MKKLSLLFFLLISFIIYLYSEDNIDKLKLLAQEMEFTYKVPNNSKILPLVVQHDVSYYLGFSNDNGKIEYRISVYSMDQLPKDLVKIKKNDELNKLLEVMAYTIALNIAQDTNIKPKYSYFNDNDVKSEFGGDVGFSFNIKGNSDFSKGYKYINVNLVYKKNRGVIIIYILFNDVKYYIEKVPKNIDSFYCIKFKK